MCHFFWWGLFKKDSLLNFKILFYILVFWPRGTWYLSVLIRDWTYTALTGRWSLYHWTTRESLNYHILMYSLMGFDKLFTHNHHTEIFKKFLCVESSPMLLCSKYLPTTDNYKSVFCYYIDLSFHLFHFHSVWKTSQRVSYCRYWCSTVMFSCCSFKNAYLAFILEGHFS